VTLPSLRWRAPSRSSSRSSSPVSRRRSFVATLTLALAVGTALVGVAQPAANSGPAPVAAPAAAKADKADKIDYAIHLKGRRIGPEARVDHDLLRAIKAGSSSIHAIVQLQALPGAGGHDIADLAGIGIRPLGYLAGIDGPSTAYVAAIDPSVKTDGATWSRLVRSVVRLTADDRVDPAFTQGDALVQFFGDVSPAQASATLAAAGLDAKRWGVSSWRAELAADQVAQLSRVDAVQWIQAGPPPLLPLNDGSRAAMNVDEVQQLDVNSGQYLGLSGIGTQIGIMDTGVDTQHNDFANRLIRVQDDGGDHGSHVAGIAAGSGVQSNLNNDANMPNGGTAFQWRGMAPQAEIAAYGQGGANVGTMSDAVNNFGIDVSNHSYVLQVQGQYDADVASVDTIARGDAGFPARTIVWAAANNASYDHSCVMNTPPDRPQYPGGCPAAFQTGYFSVLSPCKNCIDVAAVDKSPTWATFSSLGPTMDGRLGPIVSAVGVGVKSVGANTDSDGNAVTGNGYRFKGGTSMAAPAVTGVVALMRQQYGISGYGINGPLTSTDKAILIQTAADQQGTSGAANPDTGAGTFFGPGPDWATGFGIVDAEAAIDLIKADGFVEDSVTTANHTDTFPVSVVAGQGEVKVSMAWSDIAGTPGTDDAAAKLVNDLDLTLVDPNGVVHRPLVLPVLTPRDCDGNAGNGTQVGTCAGDLDSTANTGNNYAAVAAEGTDRRNVVEQVVVPNPVAGNWTARVSVLNPDTSVRLPMGGTQTYSLAGVTDARADLRVNKTDSPDPATAGEQLFYTIAVTNDGPDDATNVVVVDVLPDGVDYVTNDLPGGCVESPTGTLTCSVGDIKAGETQSFKIKVHIHPDLVSDNGGPLSIFNTATVSSNTPDDDTSDNTDIEGTIVEDEADLEVTKVCKPDGTLPAGKIGHCTIFVDNHGPSYARAVQLTDVMLANGTFSVSNVTPSQGSCGAVTPVTNGKKFVCNLGTLANATPSTEGRATVDYDVSATEAMDINNVATVTADTPDPDTTNNKAQESINVSAVTDLRITKTGPASVVAGTTATYDISITNDGPSTATGVKVEDNVPAGTELLSVTASNGATCNAGVPGDALRPTVCSFGNLAPGASRTMTVEIRVLPGTRGPLNNDARVSSETFDDDLSDNLATTGAVAVGSADLSISKSDSPDPVVAGSLLTYTIDVTNHGPSTADDVTVTDTLPAGTTYVSGVDGNGQTVCTLVQAGTVKCDLGTLQPGTTTTVYLTVKVDASVPSGTVLSNTVTVSSSTPDPNGANNTDTETTDVITSAELWLDKQATQRSGNPSPIVTFTLVVHNDAGCETDAQSTVSPNCGAGGPSDAKNVQVVDTLPLTNKKLVLQYVSPQCTYNSATHQVTCHAANVPAGATATFVIEAQVQGSVGLITNSATMTSTTPDPVAANNSNAASLVMKGGTGKK